MTPSALEELLARLQRQEQRTAALEAALLESQPTLLAHPLVHTPTGRHAETPVAPKPKRDPIDERAARPQKPDAPGAATPAAISPLGVLASLDDVVWSVSPDGQLVFFTGGAVQRLYGITEHELHNERGRWLDALPPGDRDRLRAALARLPDTDTFTLEHRIERSGGGMSVGRRWALTRGKLVRDRDGRPLRVDGVTTDVTRPARGRAKRFSPYSKALERRPEVTSSRSWCSSCVPRVKCEPRYSSNRTRTNRVKRGPRPRGSGVEAPSRSHSRHGADWFARCSPAVGYTRPKWFASATRPTRS